MYLLQMCHKLLFFRFSRTDLIFLCVFPVLFIIFNIAYWAAIYTWRWGGTGSRGK